MADLRQENIRLGAYFAEKTDIGARISWKFNHHEENGLVYLSFDGLGVKTTIDINEEDAVRLARLILENIEKKAPKGALAPKGSF